MWTIGPLTPEHERGSFDCGEETLDEWLKQRATQWTRKGLSRVFVATREGSDRVLGYTSLSSHHVEYADLPARGARGLPRQVDVPAILLGRLAVDRSAQGTGLGRMLLFDAMKRALRVADSAGVAVLEVEALHDAAREFYLHNGFAPLEDDRHHLFLSMKVIRKLELP